MNVVESTWVAGSGRQLNGGRKLGLQSASESIIGKVSDIIKHFEMSVRPKVIMLMSCHFPARNAPANS
jgi:hypothetical protein